MEYIISRPSLPTEKDEMENGQWWHMWSRNNFPFSELAIKDTLYWFETKSQRLIWKTELVEINREPYIDKKELFEKYKISEDSNYLDNSPEKGFFLGYKVRVLEQIDILKPIDYKFPQLGWLKIDNEEIVQKWFNRNLIEDTNTLDDYITLDAKSISELRVALNLKMQNISPERIHKIILTSIRKDTAIINVFKKAANFKCQFPDCKQEIKMKSGGLYVEVAHIKPVSKGGQSISGNLIVLCPNHHKEFDYGELSIKEQTINNLSGLLNGKEFKIKLA